MTEYLSEHWILSILVTIFLGAIGSGLWDALLKPIGNKVVKFLFTLLTFGTKRASNRIYKNVAKGHHDNLSLEILTLLFSGLIAILIVSQGLVYFKHDLLKAQILNIEECSKQKLNTQEDCNIDIFKPYSRLATLIAIFITVIFLYRLLSLAIVNILITRYEQCLKVIRPCLKDFEYHLLEQEFALISTKEDYEKIINHIKNVAAENNISLP